MEPELFTKLCVALATCTSAQDVDVVEANYQALLTQAPAEVAAMANEMIEQRYKEMEG